jgi:uncharacterized membrane protein
MMTLILGICWVLGGHSVSILAPGWRDRAAARLGEARWKGLYALNSIAAFALLLRGYAEARLQPLRLYSPPASMHSVTALLMLPVFPLLLATYLPGRIKRATRHPLLAATTLWALAHVLSNGTLHDVLLFGAFLAWAVADLISLGRRTPRPVPGAPPSVANDWLALGLGLGLYVLTLLWAHTRLIGVSPLG